MSGLIKILKIVIFAVCIIAILISGVKGACSSKYPFGLKGDSLEVNYVSMATYSDGNFLLAGYSN